MLSGTPLSGRLVPLINRYAHQANSVSIYQTFVISIDRSFSGKNARIPILPQPERRSGASATIASGVCTGSRLTRPLRRAWRRGLARLQLALADIADGCLPIGRQIPASLPLEGRVPTRALVRGRITVPTRPVAALLRHVVLGALLPLGQWVSQLLRVACIGSMPQLPWSRLLPPASRPVAATLSDHSLQPCRIRSRRAACGARSSGQ